MKSILFVCLGNICRSPLAEGIAKQIIQQKQLDIKVDSAGTGSWHIGETPCENSVKVAANNGIDISSLKARQVNQEDFDNFDLIVGLDESNITNLKKLSNKKVLKLGAYGYKNEDVPDPYFFDGFEGFEKVYEMIHLCVSELINEYSHA